MIIFRYLPVGDLTDRVPGPGHQGGAVMADKQGRLLWVRHRGEGGGQREVRFLSQEGREERQATGDKALETAPAGSNGSVDYRLSGASTAPGTAASTAAAPSANKALATTFSGCQP